MCSSRWGRAKNCENEVLIMEAFAAGVEREMVLPLGENKQNAQFADFAIRPKTYFGP